MAHFEKAHTVHEHWRAQLPARSPTCWPVIWQRHRPITREPVAWPVAFDVGPSQTLLCNWVQFSAPTSRPAFDRVNASHSWNQLRELSQWLWSWWHYHKYCYYYYYY